MTKTLSHWYPTSETQTDASDNSVAIMMIVVVLEHVCASEFGMKR